MYIEKVLNNGIVYLRLVESVYNPLVKGGRKKVVYNIGSLAKFDDGKPMFFERLKQSFKDGSPLVPELIPFCSTHSPVESYKFILSSGDPDCIGHPKLYSHSLLERILEELGLVSFFSSYKRYTNYQFDLLGFFRLLVYGRILNPVSKIQTIKQNQDYYNPILDNPYPYNIYDTLDFIYDYRHNITNKINKSLTKSFGRTTNVIYYDVTNFFFETEQADEDEVDSDGNTLKGLRKFGVSKEERKLPIVQMGLFMDEQGIPISIETFPGNTLDHLTMIDALKNTVDNLNLPRFIFVGDRGIYRGNNTFHLTNRHNGYIISKSISKTSKLEREWIFDDSDYLSDSDSLKYKSRIIKRKVATDNGKVDIVEKVVVYWSKKFYDKQVAENKSFLDFLDKLDKSPASFRLSRFESRTIRKFIKKEVINNITGELIDSDNLKALIDFDKLNQFVNSFGYYQLVSSELNMSEKAIIDAYHGLSRIEEQFRIMKSSLETRPLYVRTEEHIKAHLLICMISLVIIRIIQNKIVDYNNANNHKPINKNKKRDTYWSAGLSSERIQRALNKWTVDSLTVQYYRFNNIDDPDLKLILDAFGIDIPVKLFSKLELKQIKTSIKL